MNPQGLLARLRHRKLIQWALAYVAAAWGVLQLGDLLSDTYRWPPILMRALPILLLIGFFGALILAWYHGEKGVQRASSVEIGMLTALFVVAGASVAWIRGGAGDGAAGVVADSAPRADSAEISIAVLPFENLSGEKENEYFTDGIAEDILTDLSRIQALRVTSRTSVAGYKGTTKNVRTIAAELGVRYVLEGSVQRAGARVRIRPQLIDARSDRHVWAESYDRDLEDVFAIQSDIAEEISRALRSALTPAERSNIAAGRTQSLEAYDLYLKGRAAYQSWGIDSAATEKAIAFYKQALEIDPGYALAHTGLADIYADQGEWAGEFWKDSARIEIRRALEVAPDLPEAHVVLGWIHYNASRYADATADFQRALEIDPSAAQALVGLALVHLSRGELDEALRWARRAKAVGPTQPSIDVTIGRIYAALHEPALAERWIRQSLRSLEGEARNYPHLVLAEMYVVDGRFDRAAGEADSIVGPSMGMLIRGEIAWHRHDLGTAEPLFEQVYRDWRSDAPENDAVAPPWQLASIYRQEGRAAEAEKLLQLVESDAREFTEQEDPWAYARLAVAAAIRGERAAAIRWLRTAADHGWIGYARARSDPVYDGLRGDPAFEKILTDVEARVQAMRARVREEGP